LSGGPALKLHFEVQQCQAEAVDAVVDRVARRPKDDGDSYLIDSGVASGALVASFDFGDLMNLIGVEVDRDGAGRVPRMRRAGGSP